MLTTCTRFTQCLLSPGDEAVSLTVVSRVGPGDDAVSLTSDEEDEDEFVFANTCDSTNNYAELPHEHM